MKLRRIFYTAFVATFVISVGTLLIMLAKGYTFNPQDGKVEKTGWILARSYPDGARIFLNDTLVDVTNSSISSLKAGTYHIKIQKEGYHEWEKEVPVKEEFVTIAEAFLIPKAPEIRPLTATGVKTPAINPQGSQVAYYASTLKKSGIWVLSLANNGLLGAGRNNPRLIAEGKAFEDVNEITWSPNSSEILVKLESGETGIESFFLFETEKTNPPPYNSISPEETLKMWNEALILQRRTLVEKLDLDEQLKEIALANDTLFSPDEKKFLYSTIESNEIEYRVYDTTNPLPIGKSRTNQVLRTNKDRDLNIFWHTTNEHLIILEDKSINIIEIDSANQTPVFSGPLASKEIFSTPDTRGIVALMSFKKESLPDLYEIRLN